METSFTWPDCTRLTNSDTGICSSLAPCPGRRNAKRKTASPTSTTQNAIVLILEFKMIPPGCACNDYNSWVFPKRRQRGSSARSGRPTRTVLAQALKGDLRRDLQNARWHTDRSDHT